MKRSNETTPSNVVFLAARRVEKMQRSRGVAVSFSAPRISRVTEQLRDVSAFRLVRPAMEVVRA